MLNLILNMLKMAVQCGKVGGTHRLLKNNLFCRDKNSVIKIVQLFSLTILIFLLLHKNRKN